MAAAVGAGARRPGVVAVARAAGVSPSTVSNVYNRPQVVSAELRERVLAAASELGYAGADPAARSLRSGRTGAIGVVLRKRLAHSFDDPAAVCFLQGVSDAADPQQLALVIVPAYPEQAGAYSPAIGRVAVDGLLLYPLVADDRLVEASLQRRLPTVVIDSPCGMRVGSGRLRLTDRPVHCRVVAVPATPLWRRVFDRAERAVGGPLERAVHTTVFADAVVASVKVQGALWHVFERNSRMMLHLLNVPARTDVERLNRQVAALSSELRELIVRIDDPRR